MPLTGGDRRLRIACIATYVPRQCGIATFTHDLAEAVSRLTGRDRPVSVVAVKDRPEGYGYSDRVKFEIRKDHQIDYARAADFLNFSNNGVLVVQHEFGIFGGKWGANVLTLLRDLNRPVVVTCHTMFADADPLRYEIFQEIVARADRVVVMTKKAMEILVDTYSIDHSKVVLIPHGIHDVPFIDPNYFKDKFGVHAIAFGYVIGEFVRLLILFMIIRKLNLVRYVLLKRHLIRIRQLMKSFLEEAPKERLSDG